MPGTSWPVKRLRQLCRLRRSQYARLGYGRAELDEFCRQVQKYITPCTCKCRSGGASG